MSINVETIGDALMIQYNVAEVRQPQLCRMVSISAAITEKGRAKVKVVWELSAKKIDDRTCEYSSHIHASRTDEFMAFIGENGGGFEQGKISRQGASDAHNREETPNFAKSIEHRTLQHS